MTNPIKKMLAGVAFAAAGVGLLGAGLAVAGPGRGPGMMKRFDANGDGQLDEAERQKIREARQARRADFIRRHDANGDGQLDDAERQAAREARLAARFAALDTDGNGQLSYEEFVAGAGKRHFGRRFK